MEQTIIYLTLVLLGLCLGSFACASVWRIRARQLAQEKSEGEKVDQGEYKRIGKLAKSSIFSDRSRCLDCGYVLKWHDMIPVLSWVVLGGKCRKCHKAIGFTEPLSEIGLALFFVISYAFWPYQLENGFEIARLVLWLLSGVPLVILFVYDAKWSLLDRATNYILILIGVCNSVLLIITATDKLNVFLSIVGSVLILGGLYYAIYKVSRGKWVGGGDSTLGLGLALMLADWRLAFIALFVANLVGCLIVLPGMIAGKLNKYSHVPFGPLLIVGATIAGLAGTYLVDIYFYSLM